MLRKRYEWLAAALLIAAGAWLRFRIGYHWLFAGSDSYGYLKLADQLWQHGRFALSPLLRPDGVLLAVAVVPAAWAAVADRKRRLTLVATSLLAFSVVFSPWVIRNVRAFGKPAVFGGRVDRFTRPMPDYHGWWRWITSWGRDESPQTFLSTCFYNPPCTITPQMPPHEAFDSGEGRAT